MSKKINGFNKATITGYVRNFDIKSFDSGFRLANIAIQNKLDGNMTYVSMFDRQGLTYNGQATTLEGLKKIFMADEKTPRDILVTCTGKVSETLSADGSKTYLNTTVFDLKPYDDESKQQSTLAVTGMVESIKFGEDDNGVPNAKIKLGIMKRNKDKDVIGVEYVSVVAYGDDATKLEDEGVDKGYQLSLGCDMVNKGADKDKYGYTVGAPRKEIAVGKIGFVNGDYDIDEDDMEVYKKAKRLKKGESIKNTIDDDELDF